MIGKQIFLGKFNLFEHKTYSEIGLGRIKIEIEFEARIKFDLISAFEKKFKPDFSKLESNDSVFEPKRFPRDELLSAAAAVSVGAVVTTIELTLFPAETEP